MVSGVVIFGIVAFSVGVVVLDVVLTAAFGTAQGGLPESSAAVRLRRALTWFGTSLFAVAVATAFGVWIWWALWGNGSADSGMGDRWLNVSLGMAGIATFAGVLGGAYLVPHQATFARLTSSRSVLS
jgi:hypothetical protein